MNPLIEKIQKARQRVIEVGGFKFVVRRPTDFEMLDFERNKNVRESDILKKFVIGWQGVTELDIVPGGTAVEIEFDPDLFIEWIADRPKFWGPIIGEITGIYKQHKKSLIEAKKKPEAG